MTEFESEYTLKKNYEKWAPICHDDAPREMMCRIGEHKWRLENVDKPELCIRCGIEYNTDQPVPPKSQKTPIRSWTFEDLEGTFPTTFELPRRLSKVKPSRQKLRRRRKNLKGNLIVPIINHPNGRKWVFGHFKKNQ